MTPGLKLAVAIVLAFIAAAGFMLFWIASQNMTVSNEETGKSVVVERVK